MSVVLNKWKKHSIFSCPLKEHQTEKVISTSLLWSGDWREGGVDVIPPAKRRSKEWHLAVTGDKTVQYSCSQYITNRRQPWGGITFVLLYSLEVVIRWFISVRLHWTVWGLLKKYFLNQLHSITEQDLIDKLDSYYTSVIISWSHMKASNYF